MRETFLQRKIIMIAKLSLGLLVALTIVCAVPSAQAQDPWGFQFGYTLGIQNSFRNRLPTPPYFAIHPPVYYGTRYQRPYGDSPFAAFPQLRSGPDYFAVPKEVPFRTRAIVNHHTDQVVPHHPVSEPVAETKAQTGRTVVIVNPFAQSQVAQGK